MREGFERGSGQIDGEEIRMQRLRHCQRVKILDVTEEGGQGNGKTKQRVISTFTYDSFSDVGEIRVYFASKILTPCRMH